MSASARLMVLISPEERAALDVKARALGVSAGEIVRRAVQAFEIGSEGEAAELRTLIDAFNELHPETLRIADECHRKVAEVSSEEIADLRDRVSRVEGMLAAGTLPTRGGSGPRVGRRLPSPTDRSE